MSKQVEQELMMNLTGTDLTNCKKACDVASFGNEYTTTLCYQECIKTQPKQKQDAGAILQGAANVVNSLGGLYGTYVAGKTGNAYIAPGEFPAGVPPEDPEAQRKRTRNTVIILGVAIVGIGAIVYFSTRNNK